MTNTTRGLPMIAMRGMTAFPGMLLTFDIERSASMAALNFAMGADQIIFLVTQKDILKDMPSADDVYSIGTVCRSRQQLRQPNGSSARIMVEGLYRGRILDVVSESPSFYVDVEKLSDKPDRVSEARKEALVRNSVELFEEYVHITNSVAPETVLNIFASKDPGYVSDFIANHINFRFGDKQKLLEELIPSKRLAMLNGMLVQELAVLSIEQELVEATNEQMNKAQREYFLHEELKIIHKELGDEEDLLSEIDEYRQKIESLQLTDEETREKLLKEVSSLSKQQPGSAEAAVIRGYLDTCLSLPWNERTEETLDLDKARTILDEDHYGLEKIKERIVEYLAVRKQTDKITGGLLCLVGPPGTGKTSIAKSVARATNRKLIRISLGGVSDEAEIRGHRKTYIGAMPGRIITGIIQAKSKNPLIVFDEIDKLGHDFRGDPSSALLEALDSEQNNSFRDRYLEIPWDLSETMFIMTANTVDTIPRPLLDRMEVIELSSYTDREKIHIAQNYLIPKQRDKHGLSSKQLKINDKALDQIISMYTRESGVRVLERHIGSICRKVTTHIVDGDYKTVTINSKNLADYLGPVRYKREPNVKKDTIGLVHGLAWTQVGGEVLDVETAVVPGNGTLELTGNLGQVMKESAKAALTYIRSRSDVLGIDPEFYKSNDIHIHFPEGAVPKDGPSAGITVCMALISSLTKTPVRHDVAMTGEITLRGRILPIGGLREKTMAALRNGIKTVIIPQDNFVDLEQIDPEVKESLQFVPASHVDNILDIVLPTLKKQNHGAAVMPAQSKGKKSARLSQ